MDDHEKAFLAGLKENEDDEMLRLVYADWLEEQGRYEESERHRKWKISKQWFLELFQTYGLPGYYEFDDQKPEVNNKSIQNFCDQILEGLTSNYTGRDYYNNVNYNFNMSCGPNCKNI